MSINEKKENQYWRETGVTYIKSILQVGSYLGPKDSLGLPPGLKHTSLENHQRHLENHKIYIIFILVA